MKCKTVEILWHSKEPILSIDFQGNQKIATGGADTTVKIWAISSNETPEIQVTFLANLALHSKAVNVVRFSPHGDILASGSDDGKIVLWKQSDTPSESSPASCLDQDQEHSLETWTIITVLRSHLEDVYDLSWAPSALHLASASVDNTCIVWDVAARKPLQVLREHSHYVQGVSWDPLGQFLASQSSDRSCRVYSLSECGTIQPFSLLHKFPPKQEAGSAPGEGLGLDSTATVAPSARLFLDETLQSFFRRLCFTPDGSFLLCPAGIISKSPPSHQPCDPPKTSASETPTSIKSKREKKDPANSTLQFCTFLYSRNNQFAAPSVCFPSNRRATVAIRCSPIFYQLFQEPSASKPPSPPPTHPQPLTDLPYRIIFAVLTLDSILIYDTQHLHPLALVENLHFSTLTDLAWSADGAHLAVSSTDGYCSFVSFAQFELGIPLEKQQYPPHLVEICKFRDRQDRVFRGLIDENREKEREKEKENQPVLQKAAESPQKPPQNIPQKRRIQPTFISAQK